MSLTASAVLRRIDPSGLPGFGLNPRQARAPIGYAGEPSPPVRARQIEASEC